MAPNTTAPTVQPAEPDTWTRSTAEARQAFDQNHANTPAAEWTPADYDTWTNLHLTA